MTELDVLAPGALILGTACVTQLRRTGTEVDDLRKLENSTFFALFGDRGILCLGTAKQVLYIKRIRSVRKIVYSSTKIKN